MKNDVIIRSRAPLRISFGGGGTDVPPFPEIHGGVTLSTTIDRFAYVTLKNNSNHGIRVISQDYGLIETLSNLSDIKIKGKTSLIKAALLQSGLKKAIQNFNIDVKNSWLIWDNYSDINAAKKINCKFIKISTNSSLENAVNEIKSNLDSTISWLMVIIFSLFW